VLIWGRTAFFCCKALGIPIYFVIFASVNSENQYKEKTIKQ
jgi:hypothetical protein